MNVTLGYSALAVIALVGCATDPNHIWFEGAAMSFEVSETSKGSYNLVAKGAGAHNKDQVERAFLIRAVELCGGQPLNRDLPTKSCLIRVPPYRGTAGGEQHPPFQSYEIAQ